MSAFAAVIGVTAAAQFASAASVDDFNHIVVIYQENHSFDNLHGLWGDVNGEPVDGLADPRSCQHDAGSAGQHNTVHLSSAERFES